MPIIEYRQQQCSTFFFDHCHFSQSTYFNILIYIRSYKQCRSKGMASCARVKDANCNQNWYFYSTTYEYMYTFKMKMFNNY